MATRSRNSWIAGFATLAVFTVLVMTLHGAMSASGRQRPHVQPTGEQLTVYAGRTESLVGELIRRFQRETGIQVNIKYGKTGPLATLILEEGRRSPADVFFAQDPGGLGVLAQVDRLAKLPPHLLERVAYENRDPMNRWVGITGRLRTIAHSTSRVAKDDLPRSMAELTDPRWKGRIGWAPSNASFQAFVTAVRHQLGDDVAEQWLRDMLANGVRTFPGNTPIVQAIADGEIDLGLVNHYYVERFLHERSEVPVANHIPAGAEGEGDVCGAMLVSGAAILANAPNRTAAVRFIEFLLSESAQAYFANETFEYPLANGAAAPAKAPSLASLPVSHIDLNQLGDLEDTLALLRRVGALR